jgi:hypothetical protein
MNPASGDAGSTMNLIQRSPARRPRQLRAPPWERMDGAPTRRSTRSTTSPPTSSASRSSDEFDDAEPSTPPAADRSSAPRPSPRPAQRAGQARRAAARRSKITTSRTPTAATRHSGTWLLDVARAQFGRGDAAGAAERLERHAKEIRGDSSGARSAAERGYDQRARRMLSELPAGAARPALERSGLLEGGAPRRASARPDARRRRRRPLRAADLAARPVRRRCRAPARPFVEACPRSRCPAGTDTINIPKITTGTATAIQTADNAAVQKTDLADNVVTASVRTIAGQQDMAMQLLDQSPVAFDEITFRDLIADYLLPLRGPGDQRLRRLRPGQGHPQHVTASTPSPTPTPRRRCPSSTPSSPGAVATAHARKRPITHGWLTPRARLLADRRAGLRPTGRSSCRRTTATRTTRWAGVRRARRRSGEDRPGQRVLGVDHRMTDAIPVNLGAGTNEDQIIQTRMADHLWFEGTLRARALEEVLSGTLGVRLQVYAYVAFTAERFPAGTRSSTAPASPRRPSRPGPLRQPPRRRARNGAAPARHLHHNRGGAHGPR